MTHDLALQVEEQICAQMPISIALGYDDKNELEFSGYIASTSIENDVLRISCEGVATSYAKEVQDGRLTHATAAD